MKHLNEGVNYSLKSLSLKPRELDFLLVALRKKKKKSIVSGSLFLLRLFQEVLFAEKAHCCDAIACSSWAYPRKKVKSDSGRELKV